ncbi:aminotransferase class IV [Hydrogenibacillus schlegelii]|uniref:aminotransferase class IV n=1 Tax=Hydrogenibacillus schlegelii TaxID=1484 RepID=UPI00082FCC52|nr:aminotransferase class IV [Hydrogenibacillus schlegelii]
MDRRRSETGRCGAPLAARSLDHGFLDGASFFETLRTYGGRPFFLADHLARLRRGIEAAGIRWR